LNLKNPLIKRFRTFTLLEMIVALVILSLIGALSAIPIKKLTDNHQFEEEVSHLFIALQEAQLLSSTYQTDIALEFYRVKQKLYYRFSTYEPFTSQQLNQTDQLLKKISTIQFQGKKINQCHFDIFSGRIEPRGVLAFLLTSDEDSKSLWFDLQYGHLMKFSSRKPAPVKDSTPAQPQGRAQSKAQSGGH
jgi:prepilin-type N-terminal cleavage/methylation domain-containing protein